MTDPTLTDEKLAEALCDALDRCRQCEWAFKPDDRSVPQAHWTGQWIKKQPCVECGSALVLLESRGFHTVAANAYLNSIGFGSRLGSR